MGTFPKVPLCISKSDISILLKLQGGTLGNVPFLKFNFSKNQSLNTELIVDTTILYRIKSKLIFLTTLIPSIEETELITNSITTATSIPFGTFSVINNFSR